MGNWGTVRGVAILGAMVFFGLSATVAQGQNLFDRGKGLLQGLGGGSAAVPGISSLSSGEIAGGLRDALRVGAERVVSSLGRPDGFNAAADVHIPLPQSLKTVLRPPEQ